MIVLSTKLQDDARESTTILRTQRGIQTGIFAVFSFEGKSTDRKVTYCFYHKISCPRHKTLKMLKTPELFT